jgi:hypothetical protein
MNVAGDAKGIIMEARDSLYGFPGCSTSCYLVTPFCEGSAQQPAAPVILFLLKTKNRISHPLLFVSFAACSMHFAFISFLKIVRSVIAARHLRILFVRQSASVMGLVAPTVWRI